MNITAKNRKQFDLVESKLQNRNKALLENVIDARIGMSNLLELKIGDDYKNPQVIYIPKDTTMIFHEKDGTIRILSSDLIIEIPEKLTSKKLNYRMV